MDALLTSKLKDIPAQPIGPINEVQVAYIRKRTSICTPLTTRNGHKTIIRTLCLLNNPVRLPKDGCDLWLE